MNPSCTLQLFADGAWRDVGSVSLFGAEAQGWKAKTYTGYAIEWTIAHANARDAHAFACEHPVGFEPVTLPH